MASAQVVPLSSDASLRPNSPVRRYELVCLLFVGLLSSIWCVTAARELSATFDEPTYLEQGLIRWRTGKIAGLMKLGTMPLPVDVQTLPLYLWERWTGTPADLTRDFGPLLTWARIFSLSFWWLLLVYVWLTARSLAGPWAGMLALAFLACEPSIAAHASLATTDISVTACLVALCYHFQRNRGGPWRWRVAWPAFWFGLAVLAKTSGLVFGGLCLFVIEGFRCSWWRAREGQPRHSFRASFRDLMQIGWLGLALVFLYCGSDWERERTFITWAQSLPEGTFASVMVWLSENLRIFSNAGEGLIKQFSHNVRGHGTYLLGETHRRALWYYFPVVLAIKLTVPLLLGALLLGGRQLLARSWRGNWPLQAALVLFLFTPLCRVQIGVRFMFPLIALLTAGLAVVLVQAIREAPSLRRQRVFAGAGAACLIWTAASWASIWPNGMCYINPLWGRVEDGYRLVSEGNYDWGQGYQELVRWQEQHQLADLDGWLFATDPRSAYPPFRRLYLQILPIKTEDDFLAQVRGRHLAVSVTNVYGANLSDVHTAARRVLLHRKPVARTLTYLIYDFTTEPAPPPANTARR